MIDFTKTSKGGKISEFIPDRATCLNAVDRNGNTSQMVLLHRNTDLWCGMGSPCGTQEALSARLLRIVYESENIIAFQNEWYSIENGVFRLFSGTIPLIKGKEKEIQDNV